MIAPPRFLATPVGEHLSDLVREAFEQAGAGESNTTAVERFGPYRVTGEIGRGGMGMVYEAERADRTYDRRVAIKTVRFARAGGRLADEFEAERRILAGLEHENIARLYDAGTTPDGIPYFVMELVEGRRIDVYCDEENLSVDERLALFERVCEAVEHAHGKLIVHGDIKPGNILVTADGVPKLLDFGVARLLESAEPERDPVSVGDGTSDRGGGGGDAVDRGGYAADARPLAMTPEYASPEQLRGSPVTTAADVYALGILLYVLLAGRHPYPPVRRTRVAVERAIRDATIAPPSEALPPERRARGRQRRLRGDVDAIVLAAIRLDPDARYGSVGELRRDLRDHREGLPVAARPATWRYRAAKFVRRHRVGLAAAALVFVALGVGLAGTAWQARLAERQAERAERTRDYLVGLFETFDPDAAGAEPVTVRELLDRGAERLESDLSTQPVTRAELATVLGRLYQRLGLYDEARQLLVSARDVLAEARGEDHLETIDVTARLVSVLNDEGEYDEAERLARFVLEARRRNLGERDTLVARSLGALASIRRHRGHLDEARDLHSQALEIDRLFRSPEQLATRLNNLGVVHGQLGEYEEARKMHEEALEIRRGIFGDRHTLVATSLLNLAAVRRAAGAYDEAEALLRECVELRRDLLGDAHPHLAIALNHLGIVHRAAGRLDEAEAAWFEALEIRRSAFGETHPQVAESLNNLGVLAFVRGNHAEAADLFAEVVPMWTDLLGEEHPEVLTGLYNLGSAHREAGDYEAAEPVLRRVLDVRRRVLGDDHPDVGQSLHSLAGVYRGRGAIDEAERTYRDAIASWRRSLGDEHPSLAFGLFGLGRLLVEQGRSDECETPLREALALREALDSEHRNVISTRGWLGLCLVESDDRTSSDPARRNEGLALLEESLPAVEAHWGPEDELTRRIRRTMD